MRHNLGRVVVTSAVAAAVPHHQITALLDRHAAGDWGEISEDDKAANDEAARSGDAEAKKALFKEAVYLGIQPDLFGDVPSDRDPAAP